MLRKSLHKLKFREMYEIREGEDLQPFKQWFGMGIIRRVGNDPNGGLLEFE